MTNNSLTENRGKKSAPPAISYLWVGAPSSDNPDSITGHDVVGPIMTARRLQKQAAEAQVDINPVKFWCLDKHRNFYEKLFKEQQVNIEVCSIEAHISKELQSELKEQAAFVDEHLKELTPNTSKDQMIALKDMISLFILLSQPGYILDTNVMPLDDKPINLEALNTVTTGKSPDGLNDFYLLYSPARNTETAKKIFEKWCTVPVKAHLQAFIGCNAALFDELNNLGLKKFSYKSYLPNTNGKQFGLLSYLEDEFFNGEDPCKDALQTAISLGHINQQGNCSSIGTALEDATLIEVTHTPSLETARNLDIKTDIAYIFHAYRHIVNIYVYDKKTQKLTLFWAVDSSKIDYLRNNTGIISRFLLTQLAQEYRSNPYDMEIDIQNFDFSNPAKKPVHSHIINVANGSVLHQAILLNNKEAVSILVKHGADPNLKGSYSVYPDEKTDEFDAFELAKLLKKPELLNTIFSSIKKEFLLDYLHNQVISLDKEVGETRTTQEGRTIKLSRSDALIYDEIIKYRTGQSSADDAFIEIERIAQQRLQVKSPAFLNQRDPDATQLYHFITSIYEERIDLHAEIDNTRNQV